MRAILCYHERRAVRNACMPFSHLSERHAELRWCRGERGVHTTAYCARENMGLQQQRQQHNNDNNKRLQRAWRTDRQI